MRYKDVIIKYIKNNFWMLFLSALIVINGVTAVRKYNYILALEEYIATLEQINKSSDKIIAKCGNIINKDKKPESFKLKLGI